MLKRPYHRSWLCRWRRRWRWRLESSYPASEGRGANTMRRASCSRVGPESGVTFEGLVTMVQSMAECTRLLMVSMRSLCHGSGTRLLVR